MKFCAFLALVAGGILLSMSSANPNIAAHSSEPTRAHVERDVSPPIFLDVAGPEKVIPGFEWILKVILNRTSRIPAPVRLKIHLPPNVSLIEGLVDETFPEGRPSQDIRNVRLLLREDSATDILVTADVQATGFGAHLEKHYRFGRPEPTFPALPVGREIVLPGGRSFGEVVLAR